MSLNQLEELIRKYLAMGVAVVVILSGGGTNGGTNGSGSASPTVITITPTPRTAAPGGGTSSDKDKKNRDRNTDRTGNGGSTGTNDGNNGTKDGNNGGAAGSGDTSGYPGNGGTGNGGASGSGTGTGTGTGTGGSGGTGNGSGGTGSGSGDTGNSGSASTGNGGTGNGGNGNGGTGSSGTGGYPGDGSSATSGTGTSTGDGSSGTGGTGTGNGGSGGGATGTDAGSAASKFRWGTPNRSDDFTSGTGQWRPYDGAGHDGKGRRSPSAASVANGVLTITGSPDGTTAGLAWGKGQKFGRWEARVKSPAGDPSYHAVLLLWPDAENWPAGGEVDFMEISDPQRRKVDFFLHHGASNAQEHGSVNIDAGQWHDWAVEWTPKGITAFVDGEEWYRTTDTSALPPGPMHMTIQLDWFPQGGSAKQTQMQVDWVRQYPSP